MTRSRGCPADTKILAPLSAFDDPGGLVRRGRVRSVPVGRARRPGAADRWSRTGERLLAENDSPATARRIDLIGLRRPGDFSTTPRKNSQLQPLHSSTRDRRTLDTATK